MPSCAPYYLVGRTLPASQRNFWMNCESPFFDSPWLSIVLLPLPTIKIHGIFWSCRGKNNHHHYISLSLVHHYYISHDSGAILRLFYLFYSSSSPSFQWWKIEWRYINSESLRCFNFSNCEHLLHQFIMMTSINYMQLFLCSMECDHAAWWEPECKLSKLKQKLV